MAGVAEIAGDARYGLVGQFTLSDKQKDAGKNSGLIIRKEGMFSRSYRISSAFNGVSVDNIIPSYIHSEALADGSHRLKPREMHKLLEFLHQPLRSGLKQVIEDEIDHHNRDAVYDTVSRFGDVEKVPEIFRQALTSEIKDFARDTRGRAPEDFKLAQRVLNFATTGSVRLGEEKSFHHQDAQVTDDDEHVGIQEQMEQDAQLKKASEMDGKFIEGARFNAARGLYTLKIHPAIFNGQFKGKDQALLADKLLDAIREVVPGVNIRSTISLNADQLVRLIGIIHAQSGELHPLTESVSQEELVQHALSHIERRASAIEEDKLFAKLSAAKGPADRELHLQNILKSTSALTGLLTSPLLEESWKRYYYMERKDSPVSDLQKELQAFQTVAQHYIDRGNITPAELEAISHEFFPLMMFAAEAMHTFSASLEKNGATAEERALCRSLESCFRSASLMQGHLSREYMPESKRKLLDAFSMYSGENKYSAAKQVGEVLHNYVKDVVNSVKEHPVITLSVISVIVAVLRMAAWAQAGSAPKPIDPDKLVEQIDIWMPDGSTLSTYKHESELPQADIQSWHWDIVVTDVKNWITTGSPMKKHYLGQAAQNLSELGDLWRAPLRKMMELTGRPVQDGLASVRPSDHPFLFEQAFNKTLPQVDRAWQITNIPQDLSHSGYWSWSGLKGAFHGMAGTLTLLKLFDPLIDMGYTTQRTLTDKMTGRNKNKDSAQVIRNILRTAEYPAVEEAGLAPTTAERPTAPVSNIWYGQARALVDEQGLDEALLSLDQMQLAATHLGVDAGIKNDNRCATFKKEIAELGETLQLCRAGTPLSELQDRLNKQLGRVMAIEVAQTGHSRLFENFVAGDMSEKTERKLNRLGHHLMKVSDYRQTRQDERPWFYWRFGPLKNAKAALYTSATLIGEGFSHVRNGIRIAKESKLSDLAFDPLYRSNSKLVNLATRPAFMAAAALNGTSVYLDYSGKIQHLPAALQPVAESLSGATGTAAGAAFSTANFLVWNVTVSDLLQVHLATGLALSTFMSLVAHYPNRFALQPIVGYSREKISQIKDLTKNDSPNAPGPVV